MKSARSLFKYRSSHCLNCDQPLDKSEIYCHFCGQLNSTKKLSFDDFFTEFFAGIFAYDSRFYRTISALFLKPGKISKDYIEGKRQRYANPFRFYLSASIIFFILWGLTSSSETPWLPSLDQGETSILQDSTLMEEDRQNEDISLLPALEEGKTVEELYISQEELDTMKFLTSSLKRFEIFSKIHQEKEINHAGQALEELDYESTRYNQWLFKKAVDLNLLSSNPDIFFKFFISKLPFIIFFYLPVFALFIWLLYLRKAFTYMEHLIFTFHIQTFNFLLYGMALILDYMLSTSMATNIGLIIFGVYLYKGMRNFYRQNRVKTIVKFFIINLLFLSLSGIAAAFSILASFAIF